MVCRSWRILGSHTSSLRKVRNCTSQRCPVERTMTINLSLCELLENAYLLSAGHCSRCLLIIFKDCKKDKCELSWCEKLFKVVLNKQLVVTYLNMQFNPSSILFPRFADTIWTTCTGRGGPSWTNSMRRTFLCTALSRSRVISSGSTPEPFIGSRQSWVVSGNFHVPVKQRKNIDK